jgi:hypothetical protein
MSASCPNLYKKHIVNLTEDRKKYLSFDGLTRIPSNRGYIAVTVLLSKGN